LRDFTRQFRQELPQGRGNEHRSITAGRTARLSRKPAKREQIRATYYQMVVNRALAIAVGQWSMRKASGTEARWMPAANRISGLGETVMKRLMPGLLCWLCLQSPTLAQGFAPGQVWTSNHGSVLRITAMTTGGFRATFTNTWGFFFPCTTPSPATARYSVQFTMTVNFAKCRGTAVWRGSTDRSLAITAQFAFNYVDRTGKPQTSYGFDFFSRTR
jgi:hypothetical protein